nr:hypothetical protein [Clostridioides sp.]
MNEITKRKPNETNYEYKRRLCLAKLNREIDLDWSEINDLVGLAQSADHTRKVSYGIEEEYNYWMEKISEGLSDDMKEELNEKLLEIKIERIKASDEKNLANRKIRALSRAEHIVELLEDSIKKHSTEKFILNKENVDLVPTGKQGLLLCSDWHIGAEFDNMTNQFDVAILKNRVNELIDRAIAIGKMESIEKLHIGAIGDLCNGLIKTTIRLENRLDITEQIALAAELISEMVYRFAKEFPAVSLSMTSSNHERIFQDKKENTNSDTFHLLMKEMIKLRTDGIENFEVMNNDLDESLSLLDIYGEKIILSHGDKDNKNVVSSRYSQILGFVPDLICLGHRHSALADSDGKTLIEQCGSLMGGNQYAVDLRLYSQPSQKMLIFSKEYGYEGAKIIRFADKMHKNMR